MTRLKQLMNIWLKEEKINNAPREAITKFSLNHLQGRPLIAAFFIIISCGIPAFFMAEDLNIITGTITEQYESITSQIKGLLEGEEDLIANLANVTAALKQQFGWLWVGFYLVKKNELVLAPFQGPVACTRIKKGKGVCGTSWARAETLIIPDVEKFPAHIACSSLSRSEIVVPIIRNNEVIGVLDVDSVELNQYDTIDKFYLEQIVDLIEINI